MKKILTKILIGIVIVLAVFVLARNMIVKTVMQAGVSSMTGASLDIKKLNIGLADTLIHIEDLKMKNPKDFEEPMMVDLPEVYVDYVLSDIITGKLRFKEIRLNLKEFVVVKNKNGELNLDRLKALQQKSDGTDKKEEAPKKPKEPKKAPDFQVDNLTLKVGKVIYKDYSKGGAEPEVKEFVINIDEKHENIQNPNVLIQMIVFKTLFKTPISNLTNFDLKGLGSGLSNTLKSSSKMATDAVESTTNTLKDATKGITDIFKK